MASTVLPKGHNYSLRFISQPKGLAIYAKTCKRETVVTLKVCLFGKFSAKANEMPVGGLEGSKVQELFCYLLCNRDRPHSRERLADVLWNHCQSGHSRKYLRQALWHLQTALNTLYPCDPPPFLDINSDWVQLRVHESLWIDVAEFERAFCCCENRPTGELNDSQAKTLRYAIDIYKGELLEGCYTDWCLYERERLNSIYLSVLYRLMNYCESHMDWETGIQIGHRILCCDRASEKTHLQMMRLYYLTGDRTASLRQYAYCCEALAKELEVKPSKATSSLYEQIRADSFESASVADKPSALLSEGPSGETPEILKFLLNLQESLKNLQRQVEQGIKSVEDAVCGQKTTNQNQKNSLQK